MDLRRSDGIDGFDIGQGGVAGQDIVVWLAEELEYLGGEGQMRSPEWTRGRWS